MKLRTQRVHYMGQSNRSKQQPQLPVTDVFQKSYIKSHSSYYQTANQQPRLNQTAHSLPSNQQKTAQPFKGTHNEQQTVRWDARSKRMGSQRKWNLMQPIAPLDHSQLLNQQVKDIVDEFEGKQINMFKLDQLKLTFIKNNANKRNIQNYFNKYAENGKVGEQQLKNIVKEYGYDISADQAKLMMRLSGAKEGLSARQFVQLMTKQNVHFGTLRLNGSFGKPRKHFEQRIHIVIRNKFPLLRQAFRIHIMRGQPVDQARFNYIMKKLDINDLVISKAQRRQLFNTFADNQGIVNVEALLGAIVQQDLLKQPTFPPKLSDFQVNLKTMREAENRQDRKPRDYDFKRLSSIQYEKQLQKAQEILRQLKKQGGQKLVEQLGGTVEKKHFRSEVQRFLQEKGINFQKGHYDCLTSYLDFTVDNHINDQDYRKFINQNEKQAMDRFERRLRVPPPQFALSATGPLSIANDFDELAAYESLSRVKAKQLGTQMRVLFRQFDKDKDGYISTAQFGQKINQMGVLQNAQINNLINYFDSDGKGFVTFNQFAKKYTRGDQQPQKITEPIKTKSQSDWLATKKSYIQYANASYHQPTGKYTAWPQRLTRPDLSMIQPPHKAGQFIGEQNRFKSSQKHDVGQMAKQEKNRVYENRLRKLAAWNELNRQRVLSKTLLEEKRSQANDYSMRLTKEKYQQRCHQGL